MNLVPPFPKPVLPPFGIRFINGYDNPNPFLDIIRNNNMNGTLPNDP